MHARRERALGGADGEVVVVPHEGEVVEDPAGAENLLAEEVEEALAIGVVAEDGDAVIAAGHDVMQRACVFDASLPGHVPRLPRRKGATEEIPKFIGETSSEWKNCDSVEVELFNL